MRSFETHISKTAVFTVTKDFSLFFSRVIEYYKPQGKNYQAPQARGVVTSIVEIIRSFL